ncbi:hypothetical protein DCAR_0100989 [Daucus carota subsp. sativus]|uniref:Transposase-associated domain-containing protein n=1 Tax=Daucus carota subsp. sativus TaxID=79200 RepID=A0AAF0W489_DAUCS|nr:hypothetical protein DCAR_0100989 [Daucus carota subsp. sativus]
MQWYTIWTAHGEKMPEENIGTSTRNVGDGDVDMYYDADDMLRDIGEANRYCEKMDDEPNPAAKEFYKMLHSASEPIYPSNVNYTTFEFVNELLHFKNKHNCSNNGFDELLKLIGSVLPDNHKLPQTYYANDCMLFYMENSEKTRCDICNESRYKEPKDLNKKKISRKVLRYFPLTLRLQRLFMAGKTAKCMRWHHDRNVVEGELSHPADGDEWKQFDHRSEASQFAEGSREASQDISGHIFGMMSTILCEVDEMVRSLPTLLVVIWNFILLVDGLVSQ